MTHFAYKARNSELKTLEGELTAENESEALARLESMGYTPVWVREKERVEAEAVHIPMRERVPQREVTVFTRQMIGLIKSGVPILRALRTVREQCGNPKFAAVLVSL
ncbi:MAG: type II secretion system F family protein, partial [bacterium]